MAVLRVIVLLAGVVATLLFPLFVGHSLSTHETGPVIWGTAGLVVGAVLILASTRMGGETPRSAGH